MTDAEVAAMARGGESAVARRIAKHSPTRAIGTLTGKKASPPRITAAEMRRMERTGRFSQRVSERLASAAESDEPPGEIATEKDLPKLDPKRRRRV
jgi:hypothetical protein